MSQYTDLVDAIVSWTNRPELVAEMNTAIAAAINKAHRAGHFPRDLVYVDVDVAVEQIQTIDYTAAPFVRFRHLASVKPYAIEFEYDPVSALDLFDVDGYARTNIVYVVGNMINVKANAPANKVTVGYWQRPLVTPVTDINDWIVESHFDLITLWSAASVLSASGEQEIKTRVEALAALHYADLKADSVETEGR